MSDTDIGSLERRMDGAIASLSKDLSGLRTGRASANLLDSVQVDAYGSPMPLSQLGSVSVPEPRMLVVNVWDGSQVPAVEKAIRNADLGLNPSTEGQTIRIPMPELTEERRKELVKVAHKYAENARVAVRNIRRDGMDALKKSEKDGDISQDELHGRSDKVQKLTDSFIEKIDTALKSKEDDILTV